MWYSTSMHCPPFGVKKGVNSPLFFADKRGNLSTILARGEPVFKAVKWAT